eukprot:g13208.t1
MQSASSRRLPAAVRRVICKPPSSIIERPGWPSGRLPARAAKIMPEPDSWRVDHSAAATRCTAEVCNDLAQTYFEVGRHNRAMELLEESRTAFATAVGEEHVRRLLAKLGAREVETQFRR